MRLLIFGLMRGTPLSELRPLLRPCGDAPLDLVEVPGASDQAFAVVHLAGDPGLAWRLAQRINSHRLHGRRLQSWVLAMAWT